MFRLRLAGFLDLGADAVGGATHMPHIWHSGEASWLCDMWAQHSLSCEEMSGESRER